MTLSITAPTSGATVGVHQVVVAGTVAPATAKVSVGGQPAQVNHGSFQRSLYIAQPTQTITVTGQAAGYTAGTVETIIRFSPTIAAQLVAARTALTQASVTPKPAQQSAPKPSAATTNAINSAFPVSAPSTGPKTSAPSSPKSTSKAAPKPATPTAQPPTTHPTPTPTTPPLTVADIKQAYLDGCVKAGKHNSYVPYCTCTYNHLEKTGALSSRERLLAYLKKLKPYELTHDPAKLPRFVRAAIGACASKLPPLDPLKTGKPTITKLPGSTPQSTTPQSTTPQTTTTQSTTTQSSTT